MILGINPGDETEEFQLRCVERDVERGIFCSDGFKWGKSARRKLQRLFTDEPKQRVLWRQLAQQQSGIRDSLQHEFELCLPRDEFDAEDPRYFGIHWGLGTAAISSADVRVDIAQKHFKHALLTYADQARSSHYETFANLLRRHFAKGETDSAAIIAAELERLSHCEECMNGEKVRKLTDLFSQLETESLPGDERYARGRQKYTKRY